MGLPARNPLGTLTWDGVSITGVWLFCAFVYVHVLLVSRRRRESPILWRRNAKSWSPYWAGAQQAGPESERCNGSDQRERTYKQWKTNLTTVKWERDEGERKANTAANLLRQFRLLMNNITWLMVKRPLCNGNSFTKIGHCFQNITHKPPLPHLNLSFTMWLGRGPRAGLCYLIH